MPRDIMPRISDAKMPRENTVEKSRVHLSWQAQYLVKLECDFSWQAQHFVTFWEIAGARNVVFFKTKSSPRSDREGLRSGGCEMTILSSDCPRIGSDISYVTRINDEIHFAWQAQYLVSFKGDFTCSTH